MIEINNKKLCESCFCEAKGEPCPNCGFSAAEFSPDLLVLPMGTRLDDRIVIGRVMGKGGFGITYLGYDIRLNKTIAVKEYYPNGIAYRSPSGSEVLVLDAKSKETFEKGVEKFYTEAQMVAQFNGNPNIVSVYDYFRSNNTVYLVMEYLNGITLKNYIKKHGRLNDGQALFVMNKIAAALSITHSADVLHRDISPDNIMICKDGNVKLIDFGAARQVMTEGSSNLTVVMKQGYTPFEQYTKKGTQGAWTDIYSLGVSIYYALTETVIDDPYTRMNNDSEFEENKHHINNDLWNILKKCTMINASDRYRAATELIAALKSVSAPIKAEPISLTDDDLRAENETIENTVRQSKEKITVEKTAAEKAVTDKEKNIAEENDNFQKTVLIAENDAFPESVIGGSIDYGDNTDKKRKVYIIAGICAAALIIGIAGICIAFGKSSEDVITADNSTASVSEPPAEKENDNTETTTEAATERTVETTSAIKEEAVPESEASEKKVKIIDGSDLAWSMNKSILKDTFQEFEGDIRVTLKYTIADMQIDPEETEYSHNIQILGGGTFLDVTPIGTAVNEYDSFDLGSDQNELVFIIPHKMLRLLKDTVSFGTRNIIINSAILEDDTYDKEIELDGQYPGDWQLVNSPIPLEELTCYDGDVRITLDMEIGTFADDIQYQYDNIPCSYIHPIGGSDWIKLDVLADNMSKPFGNDMYSLIGSGERKFSFTISQEELKNYCTDGLKFQVQNCVVKKAYIEGADDTVE